MGKYRSLGNFFDRIFRNDLNANFSDVDADIKVQKSRVDNLITGNPQPEEVMDLRTDTDGVIHGTAWDRFAADESKKATKFQEIDDQLADEVKFRTDLFQQSNDVKFVAHRGASQVAPENSIPAYQIAGKAGFWGAETDILPTSDGVWVLMHDDTIDRTTNGTGNVSSLTLSQIKSFNIDVGSNVGLYPGLKVPTLEEFLITCKNYNLVPYIEIKGDTTPSNYDTLVSMIRKYGFETKSIIISAYPNALIEIRNRTPHIHLQYITNAIYATSIADTVALGNSSMGIEYSIATKSLIDEIHDNGMKVGVWTVNDYSIAKTLIDNGVDFITSDAIAKVRWQL